MGHLIFLGDLMKIALITSVSVDSCRDLKEHLDSNNIQSEIFLPFKIERRDFTDFDWVFAYGCSAKTTHKNRLNTRKATQICVDKIKTFEALARVGAPHPRFWSRETISGLPVDVDYLVVRQDRKGRKAEDLVHWDRHTGAPVPDGDLFTEYFEHKWEYRVTVFRDQVFVYWKQFDEGYHHFILQKNYKYPKMIEACANAAKEIGIDYCSFDVVAQSRDNFAILEANSGTILTDEVSTAIVEFFLNLE
jgi:hypothetical protein